MILFLDYDGVLHPDAVYLVRRQPVLRADGELFMWAPLLTAILEPHPDVRIVLSTSWVRVLGFSRARKALPDSLRRRVIGATWHSAMGRHHEGHHRLENNWFVNASRYEQITRYLSSVTPDTASNWVAVDDDAEGWAEPDCCHLVRTNSWTGLSSQESLFDLDAKLNQWKK
ncbi:HAD domain-containing protein [Ralstonia pseudosolanacearum]|uniref:HAD domain-containing protein n=1 Tax=Ralstonia pseudosolanacearum TaxID=1310165 RepID=UPI0018CFF578|nr:HAD domain-containing protein [Ralstonia pseudosolanacearum]